MFPRCVEDIPQLLTAQVLDTYAGYVASQRATNGEAALSSSRNDFPASVAEALAPLELIYGKVFLSAVSIALHGAEPITRYVEGDTANQGRSSDNTKKGRCIYRVGEHTLFSSYYCPCSAYAYQVLRRGEVWSCKHLLALQLVLRVELMGIQQDHVRTSVVDTVTFHRMLDEGLL